MSRLRGDKDSGENYATMRREDLDRAKDVVSPFAAVISSGIYLTGFDKVSWVLYVPASLAL